MIRSTVNNFTDNLPFSVHRGSGWIKRQFMSIPKRWDNDTFKSYSNWLQETQWWSKEQLEALQLTELQGVIKHAYQEIPFYRKLYSENNIKPEDINSLDDLNKLPFVTRADVIDHVDEFIPNDVDRNKLEIVHTSGTSGYPLKLLRQRIINSAREDAFMLRQWAWAGYHFKDRLVTMRGNLVNHHIGLTQGKKNGRGDYWDYLTDTNELVLSSMNMSEKNLPRYVDMIREFKPKFLSAYPSSFDLLSRYMIQNNINDIKLKAIFCESESVLPRHYKIAKELFGCELFAGYGHSECAVDASECEQHDGYHLSMEYGILELVDKNNEIITAPNKVGRVVATGFGKYCTTLIRYLTDDLASYSQKECACKRESVLIDKIQGRIGEFLVSKSGYFVPFTSADPDHELITLLTISSYRFVQEKEGEVQIYLTIPQSASKTAVENEFLEKVSHHLDRKEFDIKLAFVDEIPRTERGKFKYFEQRLPIKFENLDLNVIKNQTEE